MRDAALMRPSRPYRGPHLPEIFLATQGQHWQPERANPDAGLSSAREYWLAMDAMEGSAAMLIAAALVGCLIGRRSTGLLASFTPTRRREIRSKRFSAGSVPPAMVKAALHDLGSLAELDLNPMRFMPVIAPSGSSAAGLRALLVDVVNDVQASTRPRDAEAGRLLFDYYVKRVGSHEVVMERLHLSRPTFYRRLQRGLVLVAERLDQNHSFASEIELAGRVLSRQPDAVRETDSDTSSRLRMRPNLANSVSVANPNGSR